MKDKLDTYERDDRNALAATVTGLEDILCWTDSMLIMEKYGLSIAFDSVKIEWEAYDLKRLYCARANTPAGAVFFWDCKRQDVEGKNDKPKLKIVELPD